MSHAKPKPQPYGGNPNAPKTKAWTPAQGVYGGKKPKPAPPRYGPSGSPRPPVKPKPAPQPYGGNAKLLAQTKAWTPPSRPARPAPVYNQLTRNIQDGKVKKYPNPYRAPEINPYGVRIGARGGGGEGEQTFLESTRGQSSGPLIADTPPWNPFASFGNYVSSWFSEPESELVNINPAQAAAAQQMLRQRQAAAAAAAAASNTGSAGAVTTGVGGQLTGHQEYDERMDQALELQWRQRQAAAAAAAAATDEEILASWINQPYGRGGANPNVTTAPPFVPDNTGGGGGGFVDTGGGEVWTEGPPPGGEGGGGYSEEDGMSEFEMLAQLMEIGKYARQPDNTRENDLYAMLQETQNQMQVLQQQYIEALIRQLNTQQQPAVPIPGVPGAPAAPGNMFPITGIPRVASSGSNLQFSNAGLGYLNSIDPAILQALMQYLKQLGYAGQGQMGTYGELNYARPGGIGSLLQSDASFEDPLAYAGLTPQMREPAEAGLRSLFAQMGLMG